MLPFMQLCGVAPVLLALSLPVVNGELRGLGSPPLAKAKGAPHNDTIKLAAPVPQPSQPGPGSTTFAQPEWSTTKDSPFNSVVAPATKSAKVSARGLSDQASWQETRTAARGELGKELGSATAVILSALMSGQPIDGPTLAQAGAHLVLGSGLYAATMSSSPIGMFVSAFVGAIFPEIFPEESVDEKLAAMKEEIKLLVDSALFEQEFEQSQMHIVYFFREMVWAESSMNGLEPQARLAYILSLEQRAEGLRNSLFRRCTKSWGTTGCRNVLLGGGFALLQGLMICHFSLMRSIVINLAYTIENEDRESLILETFKFVGCPNGRPSLDAWISQSDTATVLDEMYNTCKLNMDGDPSANQEQCCGSMQPCKPAECLQLSQFFTRKNYFLTQMMQKYQRMSDDYRQLWEPSVKLFFAEHLFACIDFTSNLCTSPLTGEPFTSFPDYSTQIGKLYADLLNTASEGNQLMTTDNKLAEEGILDVNYLAPKMGDMYFVFDLAQAEAVWGASVEGFHYVEANGRDGEIRIWTNNPDCGSTRVCGRWQPYDTSLVRWQPGDKIRLKDALPVGTRTYHNKMAGWALIEWTTRPNWYLDRVASVQVNGTTFYPSNGKTLVGSGHRRRAFSGGWHIKDAEPFSVEVEVAAGTLQVDFGSYTLQSFSIRVSPNPFPKEQVERVSTRGAGCSRVEDQFWTCAGEGPELRLKTFEGDATVRFKMRLEHNAKHSAAGIILGNSFGTGNALLLLDVSDSKPTLAVEGAFFGSAKNIGDSPIRSGVWHDYEVAIVAGAFYVLMNGKMLVHQKLDSIVNSNWDYIGVRPWRNRLDVKHVKYGAVRNTITVLGTSRPEPWGDTGKYFNFDRDDLGLPEGQTFDGDQDKYMETLLRTRQVEGSSYMKGVFYRHCRNGVYLGKYRLMIWTKDGRDGGDSHGRREKDAADGDFQKDDKLTRAANCGLAGV